MAQQGLKIVIGADITEAQSALKEVVTDSRAAGKQIDKSFSKASLPFVKNLNEVSQSVKKVTPQISALGDSIETLRAKALARKNFLITETDIGKIKIYNNEIKALESEIARLQTAGTSSLGAIGSAGGKAFSILRQAAFILPGIGVAGILGGISDVIIGLFKTGEAAKEAQAALKEFVKPISDIRSAAAAGTQEELSKVTALTNAVLNQALSYKERNNALNQLKEINKSYFGDLTVETAALGLLKTRVDEYTQAIINQAVIKAFSDEIGKLAVELSKQEKAFNDAGAQVKKFNDEAKAGTSGIGALGEVTGRNFAGVQRDLQKSTEAFNAQGKIVGALRGQMFDLRTAIQEAVNESLQFRPLETNLDKVKKKAKETAFEYDALKQIFKDLIAIQKEFSSQIQTQVTLRAALRLDLSKGAGSAFSDFSKQIPAVSAELQRRIDEQTKNNPLLKISAQFTLDMSAANAEIRRQLSLINGIIVSTASDAFAGLGETIGAAIGGGDITSGLQSFVNTVAGGIQSIGKQLIQLGTVALLAKSALKSLFSNPATMIAAGVALVAVGAALKQTLAGGVKGFAEGGLVFGPQLGLIGEGPGTSRSNPEVVAPLDQLKAMLGDMGGGGRQVIVLSTRVKGNDLLLSNSRTSRSNRRLGARA